MAKGVEVAAIKVAVQQSLDAQYLLARDTPVDVGRARSNWRISVGRPLSGAIPAYRPYPSRHLPPYVSIGSKSERANLNAVMAQGKARLARYVKGPVYISNNLPYIGPLDRGHSRQTSAGFVLRAVTAATVRTAPKIKPIFDKEFSK